MQHRELRLFRLRRLAGQSQREEHVRRHRGHVPLDEATVSHQRVENYPLRTEHRYVDECVRETLTTCSV